MEILKELKQGKLELVRTSRHFRIELFHNVEKPIIKMKVLLKILDELLKWITKYDFRGIEFWCCFCSCFFVLQFELVFNYSDDPDIPNILLIHFPSVVRISQGMLKSLETTDDEIENEKITSLKNKLSDIIYLFGSKGIEISKNLEII